MIRQNSVEAYNYLVDNDLLAVKQWKIYKIVFIKGPMTANQICKFSTSKGLADSNIRTRLWEMRQMGLIKESHSGICPISNKKNIYWDVTDRKIPKQAHKPTLTQQLKNIDKKIAILKKKRDQLLINSQGDLSFE